MSLTKRTTTPALRALPYSASQVPAAMPSGVPIASASPHITALPKKALSRPPSCIGGGVILVNKLRSMPGTPLDTSVHRIQARKNRPNNAVTHESSNAMALVTRRRLYSDCDTEAADISCPPDATAA